MNKVFKVIFGLIMIALVGTIDYFSGPELGLSLFYLLPVFFIAWKEEIFWSVLLSCLAAGCWTLIDYFGGKRYPSIYFLYWNVIIRTILFLIVVMLISRLKQALKKEYEIARFDFKTGVANSRYFFEVAAMEIERSRRYGYNLTLAYLDCDNFKKLNDSFGHRAGDALLKRLTQTIKKEIRVTDLIARLGGDEFVIFCPQCAEAGARQLMQRVYEQLNKMADEEKVPVTASIGVATFAKLDYTLDEMIHKADSLMYEAKNQGKNRIVYEVF
ncbi:MAG: diguanylate cyclase [Candidatus Omnitrophica bacterium]|nr:diguanylate cyclase [Candidatus Omnitrophota bacterium]